MCVYVYMYTDTYIYIIYIKFLCFNNHVRRVALRHKSYTHSSLTGGTGGTPIIMNS